MPSGVKVQVLSRAPEFMNIRIIAGIFGGRKLSAPDNARTHPMSERARNALFNSLGDTVNNAGVLDVFAGTGAIGIEALSRGARHVTFIEKDRVAAKILTENIASLNAENHTTIIRAGVARWLETAAPAEFDLIFADPPYHDPQFSTVKKLFTLLKPGGRMLLSHPGRGEVPTETGIVVVDNRSYGNAHLTFYRRER